MPDLGNAFGHRGPRGILLREPIWFDSDETKRARCYFEIRGPEYEMLRDLQKRTGSEGSTEALERLERLRSSVYSYALGTDLSLEPAEYGIPVAQGVDPSMFRIGRIYLPPGVRFETFAALDDLWICYPDTHEEALLGRFVDAIAGPDFLEFGPILVAPAAQVSN